MDFSEVEKPRREQGEGVTCICRDTRMCHYFGYFFGVAPGFCVPFWAIPGFLDIIFWLFSDLGVSYFLVKLVFVEHNPDFWVLILILY